MLDAYKTLGVYTNATDDEIKKASWQKRHIRT